MSESPARAAWSVLSVARVNSSSCRTASSPRDGSRASGLRPISAHGGGPLYRRTLQLCGTLHRSRQVACRLSAFQTCVAVQESSLEMKKR
jgi:hypothetical protein